MRLGRQAGRDQGRQAGRQAGLAGRTGRQAEQGTRGTSNLEVYQVKPGPHTPYPLAPYSLTSTRVSHAL